MRHRAWKIIVTQGMGSSFPCCFDKTKIDLGKNPDWSLYEYS